MIRDEIVEDKGQIIINNKVYYYKRNDTYIEILGQLIADLFNIHHAKYIPITHNCLNYYLSEDLNNYGEFKTSQDIGFDSFSFNNLLTMTKNIFNDNNIITDLYKMYFMDLIVLNIDRNNDNYGFLIKDNKTDLYILDHDCCFTDTSCLLTSIDNKPNKSSILEIDYILQNFDTKYKKMFLNMYNQLDINKLKELINKTEQLIKTELPNKNQYLIRYNSLRETTKALTKKHI